MNITAKMGFVRKRQSCLSLAVFLCAYRLHSAETSPAADVKLPTLRVAAEIYSNVTVTAVSATDIYFIHSRGIGNAKLKSLDPDLQRKFHFDAKKALEKETEEKQITAKFRSWISLQTNSHPARAELPPAVSVEVADPTIEYKYYNLPLGRPEDIQEGMLGNTSCAFSCASEISVLPEPSTNGEPFAFRIEAIKFSVGLPVTITLPSGCSQKLKDHEEGHRRINEHFYSLARKAAELAIQVALTNPFPNTDATNLDSAEEDFVLRTKTVLQAIYWKYTSNPSRPANAYYDEITDHGRNDVDSAQAAQKAIERYALEIPEEATDMTSTENR